jgi:hypothetical protein
LGDDLQVPGQFSDQGFFQFRPRVRRGGLQKYFFSSSVTRCARV